MRKKAVSSKGMWLVTWDAVKKNYLLGLRGRKFVYSLHIGYHMHMICACS